MPQYINPISCRNAKPLDTLRRSSSDIRQRAMEMNRLTFWVIHSMDIPAGSAERHSGYKHTGQRPQSWRSRGRSTAYAQTVSPLVAHGLHDDETAQWGKHECHCSDWCWISVLSGSFSRSIFDLFLRQTCAAKLPRDLELQNPQIDRMIRWIPMETLQLTWRICAQEVTGGAVTFPRIERYVSQRPQCSRYICMFVEHVYTECNRKWGYIFGTSFTYKTRKNIHFNLCQETFILWIIDARAVMFLLYNEGRFATSGLQGSPSNYRNEGSW
jgi:hypothetical protein